MRYTKIRISRRTYLVVAHFVGNEDSLTVVSRPLSLLQADALVKFKNNPPENFDESIRFPYAPKW